jgi:hypothetical protein
VNRLARPVAQAKRFSVDRSWSIPMVVVRLPGTLSQSKVSRNTLVKVAGLPK